MSLLRIGVTGPWVAVTGVALLGLSACRSTAASTPPEPERVAAPATSTLPATPIFVRMRRLLSLASPLTNDAAAAIAELEAGRPSMAEADVPLCDKALAVLRKVSAPESHEQVTAAFRLYIDLLQLVAQRYPDDLATAHAVVGTMNTLPGVVSDLELQPELEPAALRQQALALARALVRRFPRDAQAWGQVGDAATSVDPLEAMRAFQSCAALDATVERCATLLQTLRADYVRPYCDSPGIRADLAWKAAAARPEPELLPAAGSASVPGPLYVLSTPRFSARDVQQIELGPAGTTPEVTLVLRPEARAPFAAWLGELRAQERFAVLVVGDKPILRGPQATSGRAADSWTLRGLTLADLCSSTTHQTLPVDLTRPQATKP